MKYTTYAEADCVVSADLGGRICGADIGHSSRGVIIASDGRGTTGALEVPRVADTRGRWNLENMDLVAAGIVDTV